MSIGAHRPAVENRAVLDCLIIGKVAAEQMFGRKLNEGLLTILADARQI